MIQLFTNLDWFRFHGKQSVISQLQQEGFYDIKISRKMNLEDGSSFIRITGCCLSTEEGAVCGLIEIYKDRIDSETDTASVTMKKCIEINQSNFFIHGNKKQKTEYHYKTKKVIYK